jgi:signal transduction histidine kinase
MVAVGLAAAVVEFAGAWARPPAREIGIFDQANDILHIIEAFPADERNALAAAATTEAHLVGWHPSASTMSIMLDAAASARARTDLPQFMSDGWQRPVVTIDAATPISPSLKQRLEGNDHKGAYFLATALRDGSWVVFTASTREWGLSRSLRIGIGLALVLVSITAVSVAATFHLSRPIRQFTDALRRFGADPRAQPIPETGPRELRASISAFNAMQAQIQKFVDDRTAMLAAISHDLRTPLTKMRLRGEFVEDAEQRSRLSRDVDEMQAMVDSALAFFRDDFKDEETTIFELPALLRDIADDYGDQGHEIGYAGPDRLAFFGRPFALKRALTNLVDNAVKYARAPGMELMVLRQEILIVVRDSGPGIPADAREQVFAPFFRLEKSRNRATGGVGLGLTSARAVVRAHGGDIALSNGPTGGLEVRVTLPELLPGAGRRETAVVQQSAQTA